ncbi:MAG: EF-hand domain-containing protein [Candidatus Didemnitutus sp.]|nr:EF-hand domain-containing protein [Candidatus Didemnitutus sp.]
MSISSVSSSSSLAGATRPDPSEFLQKMFARLDGDGDGKVTQDEFVTAMEKRLGANASAASDTPDAASVFQKMDSDGDGGIDLGEFKTAMETLRTARHGGGGPQGAGGPPPPPPPGESEESSASEDAQQVFDAMDTNKDGKVSADELLAALKKKAEERAEAVGSSGATPTEADFQKVFAAIDGDGDGSITQAELTTLFQQLRGPRHGERTGYGADGEPSYEGAVGENLSTSV